MGSVEASSRLKTTGFLKQDVALCELTCEFSIALDATTRAIYHADVQIADDHALAEAIATYAKITPDISAMSAVEKNTCLALLARGVANEHGWLEGWICLSRACPSSCLHSRLMEDVAIGVKVYNNIRVSGQPRSVIDMPFSVVQNPQVGHLDETGLKTIGGNAWKTDPVYEKAISSWMPPKDLILGPCPAYGWMGQCKQVEHIADRSSAQYFWTSQLLGIVDYDLDKANSTVPGGIANAIERTAKLATTMEGRMRGVGWGGLMTVDQQLFTRHKQVEWAREGKGSRLIGPENISPQDFSLACYSDCAALGPFASHGPYALRQSRKTMFGAVLLGNLHDLVFDVGYSSRISGAAYADATGAFEHDLPQAWLIGLLDSVATQILQNAPDQRALYGDNSLVVTAMWCIFNVRYRAWERFVKYTRLLRRSTSPKAAAVLRRAEDKMVLVPEDLDQDLPEAWAMAVDPKNATKLSARRAHTETYVVRRSFDDLTPPTVCERCSTSFDWDIHSSGGLVDAVPGLPSSVTESLPAALAVAIRRAALWAISPESCDACAAIVGTWANDIGDKVLVALMNADREVSSREWLLMNYFVGCVALSPLRVVSILTGFDLIADIRYDKSALGERDNIEE